MDDVDRFMAWDEERDRMHSPPAHKPWKFLGAQERRVLDLLSEGGWLPEEHLRNRLGWGHVRFLWVMLRMSQNNWVEARQADSLWKSEYRLHPLTWG
jgi:hypothetical protein